MLEIRIVIFMQQLMHLSIETPTPPHPGPMWGNVGDCYGI